MVVNPAGGQQTGKIIFPCSRLHLRVRSRETRSAVPSRVSLRILHTHAESGAYSRDSSRFPRRRRPLIHTAIHRRVIPDFMRSRSCVPMMFAAESPPARASSPQGSSSNGCCCLFRHHHVPINVRLSFPIPTISMKRLY